MLGYLTEIDLKRQTVITTFRGETRTFVFNYGTFPLVEALKVSAEDAHNQITAAIATGLPECGRADYEADVRRRPNYHDGAPRKTWEQLSEIARQSWAYRSEASSAS